MEGWVGRVDHLLMNDKEILGLTGAAGLTEGFDSLASRVADTTCLVAKIGRNGAILRQGESVSRAVAPVIEVFDTVGAGDAFKCGLPGCHFRRCGAKDSLQAGVNVASRVISRFPRGDAL